MPALSRRSPSGQKAPPDASASSQVQHGPGNAAAQDALAAVGPQAEEGGLLGVLESSVSEKEPGQLDALLDKGGVIELGVEGSAVLELQQLLGFGKGGQTGVFGPTTRQRLVEVQADLGIGEKHRGKLGRTTRQMLLEAVGKGSLAEVVTADLDALAPSGADTEVIDQHRMNHDRSGAFCGVATLLMTLQSRGIDPGVDIDDNEALSKFSSSFYTAGSGSSGSGMAAKMQELGIDASFTTKGTMADVAAQVGQGRPMPVGVVQMQGTVVDTPQVSARYGSQVAEGKSWYKGFGPSGHWVTVVGIEGPASAPKAYLVNDPDTGSQLSLTPQQLANCTKASEGIWLIKG